jgi:ketosteroid isomerase-like protein
LENYLPEHFPFGGRYEGRDGMLQYLQEISAAIDMGPLDMQEWLCEGNSVAVRGEEGSLVLATQKRYHMRFVHWLSVNERGQITNMREFNDTAAMAEAF